MLEHEMITLEEVRAASERLKGKIRPTPLVRVEGALQSITKADLWLKLECLQVTGSFKARGATNKLLSLGPEAVANGIVTASGGNHGLAVARAGRLARVPAIVFLPEAASPHKAAKLREWGADVRYEGKIWDDSNAAAQIEAQRIGAAYFHPFADPAVVAGQGTIALEILEELSDVDLFLIAIGGGGLITGMSTVIRKLAPRARIVGVEPVGSPTLKRSLEAGEVVTLPALTTRVATMACGRTVPAIFEAARTLLDDVVLVEDDQMVEAARWLWFEMGIAADLSGAAGIAALQANAVTTRAGQKVCTLVCGAGPEGIGP